VLIEAPSVVVQSVDHDEAAAGNSYGLDGSAQGVQEEFAAQASPLHP
jgi:hypothetical protein